MRSKRLGALEQSDIRAMTRACLAAGGLNLGQGICDLPTPSPVAEGAVRAIRARQSTYSFPEGIPELRAKLAEKLRRDNGLEADPRTEIVVTAGSAAAYTCALHGLLDAGDGILIPEPYYGYHVGAALVAGLVPEHVRLRAPEFRLDEAALAAAVTPRTRALVLCTPSNPTGRMLTRAELEGAARVAARHDLLVITDEIYECIRYDGREHISPATIAGLRPRTVTIMGLSKTFSITGWRLGYAVAPPELAAAITLVHDLFYICAPTPLQHGAVGGLDLPESFYADMRADYANKRARIVGALDAAGLAPVVPEGAYYILADVSALGEPDSKAAALRILAETGVASIPGRAFHSAGGGEHLVRFCYAKEDDILDEACRRLERWRPRTR